MQIPIGFSLTGLISSLIGIIFGGFLFSKTITLPKNAFFSLIRSLAVADIFLGGYRSLTPVSLFSLMIIIFHRGELDQYRYPLEFAFLIVFNYMFHTICFLGFAICYIPFKIIVFNGSIENFNWERITIGCLALSIPLIVVTAGGNAIADTVDSIIIWISIVMMAFSSFICYKELQKQARYRQSLLSSNTFEFREVYQHQASLMMINFVRNFAAVYVLIFLPLVISITWHIISAINQQLSQDTVDTFDALSRSVTEILVGSFGLLHFVAIYFGLKKRNLEPKLTLKGPVTFNGRNFIIDEHRSRSPGHTMSDPDLIQVTARNRPIDTTDTTASTSSSEKSSAVGQISKFVYSRFMYVYVALGVFLYSVKSFLSFSKAKERHSVRFVV